MKKFIISSAFIIGHEVIDREHVELVNILNDMIDYILKKNVENCVIQWNKFCEKLKQHFIHEMEIMDELGYDGDNHNESHDNILNQIYNMCNECKTTEDWTNCICTARGELLSIILKHDLEFSEYLDTIGYNKPKY